MSADVDGGAEVRRLVRRERWQRRLTPIGLVLVLVVLVGAVVDRLLDDGWHQATFKPEWTTDDAVSLTLDGGGCGLELRTTVTETSDVVFILLEQHGRSDDGCGNATQVELAEPVGDRDVVDESNGQRWRRGVDPEKPRRWTRIDETG